MTSSSSKRSEDWDFDRPAKKYEEEEQHFTRPKTREPISNTSGVGDEAQKKFGNAKAISSDQFFVDSRDNDVSYW